MNMKVTEVVVREARNAKRGYYYRPRIHIFPEGESLIDNLINRRSRPIKEFRAMAKQALESLDIDHSKLDIKWSQKAGCSCGCSPGFIVEGFAQKLHRSNLYVTVQQA